MPELVQLCNDYKEKGVIFVGVHCQNVPNDQVIALCEELGLNFTIVGNGSVRGANFQGIPHAFIFDHKGDMVFNGHPAEGLDQKLKECVKAAPDWLTGPGPFSKLKSVADEIQKRKNLGKNLKTLREKINSADAAEQEEAKQLFQRLSKFAQQKLDSAKTLKETEPANYLKRLEEVAKMFKDDETGTDAQKTVDELKKDQAFQKELDAEKEYRKIEELIKKDIKRCDSCTGPFQFCDKCSKKNAQTVSKIKSSAEKVIKNYPDTICAKKCEEIKQQMEKSAGGNPPAK